jgi:hypothetical protein
LPGSFLNTESTYTIEQIDDRTDRQIERGRRNRTDRQIQIQCISQIDREAGRETEILRASEQS